MIDWRDLIDRRNAWIAHNFPEQQGMRVLHSIMGVVEEVGELFHAHLKAEQGIRGNEDHEANAKDAVGDITVYLLGVMNVYGSPQGRPKRYASELFSEDPLLSLFAISAAAGELCEASIEGNEFKRVRESIDSLVHYLSVYCDCVDWDYEAIVNETWAQVETRDWIKYPETGRPS